MNENRHRFETNQTDRIADLAYRKMEHLFICGELEPGSMISEGFLAQKLELGRAPVRDAIKRFEAGGLLKPLHRKGILVIGMDIWEHLHLLEVREPIEVAIASLAAVRANDEERNKLLSHAQMFAEAITEKSDEKVIIADFEYKKVMISATRNPYFENVIEPIHILSRRFWNINANYKNDEQSMTGACEKHIKITTAVASGDSEAAKQSVEEFISFLRHYVRNVLERQYSYKK